ncbi:Sodium Bile acid symporter family protein [Novipirellula aureliae]|uniref:Sodium Bile acid symporter family protein n=1 Tax=Novipirellula aureliae TaxID=2527966 RepID=A0A5C6DIM0_9BACT|nr:Sodium Bile acid symporter family protein [Novipirellula aureliae]
MVKIDFNEVVKAGKAVRPVGLTLFINWAIKPFTMYAIASFFLGTLFLGFIGPEAVDYVKAPLRPSKLRIRSWLLEKQIGGRFGIVESVNEMQTTPFSTPIASMAPE